MIPPGADSGQAPPKNQLERQLPTFPRGEGSGAVSECGSRNRTVNFSLPHEAVG